MYSTVGGVGWGRGERGRHVRMQQAMVDGPGRGGRLSFQCLLGVVVGGQAEMRSGGVSVVGEDGIG